MIQFRFRRFRCFATSLVLGAATFCAVSASAQNAVDMKPTPQQTEWQDLQFGVIIHFGLNTYLNQEWGNGTASPKIFDPKHFDPDQWMKAIKASGAKYVVFVAKHHDGFCLWPTAETKYSVASSPWEDGKGNVVRAVEVAAHKYGLKFGIYLSPWDRHEPIYKDAAAYDKFYEAQLTDLASHYGPLEELWLDGAGSAGHVYNFKKYMDVLRTYQPNTIVFADMGLFQYGDARWVGNEQGVIPYQNWNVIDRHGYLRWRPVEADTPLHTGHWYWHPHDLATLKSVQQLVKTYDDTVGRGGQLMLGVAPDEQGLLPEADVQRLRAFGKAIRARYSQGLLQPQWVKDPNIARALDNNLNTYWRAPKGSHTASLVVDFPHPITFDHALTMEWLVEGQRVQQYSIDAWKNGRWVPVVSSYAIGHEKIDAFAPVTSRRVRLHIIASNGTVRIRRFQLFSLDGKTLPGSE